MWKKIGLYNFYGDICNQQQYKFLSHISEPKCCVKLNLETYDTSFNSTLGSRIVLKINNIPQNLFSFVCPTS